MIVLIDSDEAARLGTVEGWISRDGFFYGINEEAARYRGCTHLYCASCHAIIPREGLSICNDCKIKRYNEFQKKKWIGEAPLYSEAKGIYFFNDNAIYDYLEKNQCSVESLRLVICEPNYFRLIDESFFSDDLSDNDKIPKELQSAIDAINTVIKSLPPASWSPGKYAADL